MNQRHTTIERLLQEAAAQYLNTQSNKTSLITITGTKLSKSRNMITFLVSIFPESSEGPAIGFLMRKRGDCKKYLKDKTRIQHMPHVEFELDSGEKNRQKVDDLLSE